MYQIIHGRHTSELQIKVNAEIRNGYAPLGGPVVLDNGNLCQAMIKQKSYESNSFDIHNYERHR